MIVVLLVVIIVILLPGGIGFLGRLWTGICLLFLFGLGYFLLRKKVEWLVDEFKVEWLLGGIAVAVLGLFAFRHLREQYAKANNYRASSSPATDTSSADYARSPAPPIDASSTAPEALVVEPTKIQQRTRKEVVNPNDPFERIAFGRATKRALPELQDLLSQPGMVEVFKTYSSRLSRKSSGGKNIWHHPAGIYMAVPEVGRERLFSAIAAARDYHDQHPAEL